LEAIEASARSTIHAAQLLPKGEGSAFAACRPPGHAYRDQAAGFCCINRSVDGHEKDPLSQLRVSDRGFQRIEEIFGSMPAANRHRARRGHSLDVIASAPRRFVAGFCSRY
jgi:acetoin utilization deacetylase AcuC-like enzyme